MTIPNAVQEIILKAGRKILEETQGQLSDDDRTRLIANFKMRIPMYAERHPIRDLLTDLQVTADAGHTATVITNKAIRDRHRSYAVERAKAGDGIR